MSKLLKVILLGCFSINVAWANEAKLDKIEVARDKPAIARCHTLKYIKYRDLLTLGVDKKKVDEWRGDAALDTPLMAQMSEADAMASFNKVPPDLSLMASAREGGPDYVYSYLIGYFVGPDGVAGNHIFPETRMPDPLGISGATDATQRTGMQNTAKSIVNFLTWAADPHASDRMRLGYYVMGYLLVLTGLLYFLKKQIWSRLK
jgi:ubiquinol-cytochrome c reductase cytochrome c1 subunit